jgi:eukaryotic-like serine/threonine-protein kinase
VSQKICPQCNTLYDVEQKFCPKDGTTLRMQGGQTGDLVGSVIADRYNVIKKLGEGGMGTVYLAEHVKMGRKSAIKVMNPGMVSDADAISRFNREASNASRINHPNVAAVYDFGETSDGLIFLAMEFIEGPSLTKVIEESGSLPPARAAEITRQAAEALAAAHDLGIVHRDLKPDNIMLAKGRDGSDIVKVVDFGIAKAAADDTQKVTKTGLVVGTPEYMSPEQLAGDKLDGRSDTYSLALVSYAMLTGKLPFPAETIQESMIKRLTDAPLPLATSKADVAWPESVQAVMDRALERDAAGRYQSASEFGRALHTAVQAMPRGRASAATAVLESVSAPAPAASAPKTKATPAAGAEATNAVPATRVNQATPHSPPAAVPDAAKSKAPVAMAAVLVLALVGGGGWYMMNKGKGATETLNQPLSQSATPSGAPVASVLPANVSVARALESVPSDTSPATAREALAYLQPLDSLARLSDDSTRLQFRYLRSRALIGSGDTKSGCDTLKNMEAQLMASSKLKRGATTLLTNVCTN